MYGFRGVSLALTRDTSILVSLSDTRRLITIGAINLRSPVGHRGVKPSRQEPMLNFYKRRYNCSAQQKLYFKTTKLSYFSRIILAFLELVDVRAKNCKRE